MRDNKLLILIFIVLILGVWASQGYSLLQDTHKAINEEVAQRTINSFSLDGYLKNNLGFEGGFEEFLYGYSGKKKQYVTQDVRKWLGEGGDQEDVPGGWLDFIRNEGRANNHFHNPLKTDWNEAGLNDFVAIPSQLADLLIPPEVCGPPDILTNDVWCNYTGQSQILWAQDPGQNVGGEWSWPNAREYFYIALTGMDFSGGQEASTEIERERYFADTFRAVGQLMHLVVDTSVPQHTRNDIHATTWHYEYAVEKIRTMRTKYPTEWDGWMNNPVSFNKSIFVIPPDYDHPGAPVPISRIIDTDKYDGTNPERTIEKGSSEKFVGIFRFR